MTRAAVLAHGLAHPEGPDTLPDGRLVFVETFLGRISVWNADSGVRSYADVRGGPAACVLGADGIVYLTQNGGAMGPWRSDDPVSPSIQAVNRAGGVATVIDSVEGEALRAPNDLVFGPEGDLYFTDPGPYDPEHPVDGWICAVGPRGDARLIAEVGASFPNGIVAELDGGLVWGDSYTGEIRRRSPGGQISLVTTLPPGHIPDGIKCSTGGDYYVASLTSGGVDVLARDGSDVAFLQTGGAPQNCTFVGTDLVVTDWGEVPLDDDNLRSGAKGGRLLRIAVGAEGRPPVRGKIDGIAWPERGT